MHLLTLPFLVATLLLKTQFCAASSPLRRSSIGIEGRPLEKIYHAALEESRTLRVAWGGDFKASGAEIKTAFENQFPGIKLDVRLDLSKYLDARADMAYALSKGADDGIDVAVLQSLHDFPRWKSEDRLLPYKVAQWNDIYPQFVDRDGAYTGLYIFSFGSTIYNANVTATSSLPATFVNYLEAKWHDKLVLTYPTDDDAVLFLFKLIIGKYGFDYMRALLAQKPHWVRGTATPAFLISSTSNSRAISFTSGGGFAPDISEANPQDVFMTWPQTGAIFANTKAPETAKLFLNFLMGDEWQQVITGGSGYATRRSFDKEGVFNQSSMDPLAYGRFMNDRRAVEAFRFQLESVIGPPQGQDPVDEY